MRVEQGGDEARVVGSGQSQHREAVLEVGEATLLFVRRQVRGNEIDTAEIEFVGGGAGHGEMAEMHRIKRPAEESDLHAYLLCLFLKAARLGIRFALTAFFLFLRGEMAFFRGLEAAGAYVPARISATRLPSAYFSSEIPLPVTAEISYSSSLSFLAFLRRLAIFSGLTTSILDATRIIGFFSTSAPKLVSSSMITL